VSSSELNAVEHVFLTAGNLGLPGAPILNLALFYNPDDGTVSGEALITQSITPPHGRVVIRPVSGPVHGLGLGNATRVFSLSGEYVVSATPPAIGSYLAKFEATFGTDNNWSGHGSFSYDQQKVNNVPIKKRG